MHHIFFAVAIKLHATDHPNPTVHTTYIRFAGGVRTKLSVCTSGHTFHAVLSCLHIRFRTISAGFSALADNTEIQT